jgi:lysophospholipase L1-like esterase
MIKGLFKLKWLITGYILLIHVVLITVIISPSTVERAWQLFYNSPTVLSTYQGQVTAHAIQDRYLPKGCVVIIGDSIPTQLDLTGIVDVPVSNFSIIGDCTEGMLSRIPQYKHLNSAGMIFLEVGINDLARYGDDKIISNFGKILELLPRTVPVIVSSILPINENLLRRSKGSYITGLKTTNSRIKSINVKVRELCQMYDNISFIDASAELADETGNLRREYTIDGLHLSPQGYKAWAAFLKSNCFVSMD